MWVKDFTVSTAHIRVTFLLPWVNRKLEDIDSHYYESESVLILISQPYAGDQKNLRRDICTVQAVL